MVYTRRKSSDSQRKIFTLGKLLFVCDDECITVHFYLTNFIFGPRYTIELLALYTSRQLSKIIPHQLFTAKKKTKRKKRKVILSFLDEVYAIEGLVRKIKKIILSTRTHKV